MSTKFKSIYIIGVGGISMSAIARILHARGIKVYGSDIEKNSVVDALISDKIITFCLGDAPQFACKCDAVTFSAAVPPDNTDLIRARSMGVPIFTRAQILGMIASGKRTISIAGTHGKSTTTGMISSILLAAGLDPTIHIGGILKNIDSNVRIGKGEHFITEACEYKDSFLSIKSDIAIILNVAPEHLDYFVDFENELASFEEFASNTDEKGCVIVCADDDGCRKLHINRKVVTFGIDSTADVMAVNLQKGNGGKYSFDLTPAGRNLGRICLPCPGRHNIYNALAACAAAIQSGIDFAAIAKGISQYKGLRRRFEILQWQGSNLFVHDYAHHPDEIIATLAQCRDMGFAHVLAIFQPHTFTRTRDFWEKFIQAFDDADQTILLPVYPAREKPIKGISSLNLQQAMQKHGKHAIYFDTFDQCESFVRQQNLENTLVIFLGAGDIEHLAYRFS